MKDPTDERTEALLGPIPNKYRQAAYANRQRALGRRKFSYWMRPEEAGEVASFLERLRTPSEAEVQP